LRVQIHADANADPKGFAIKRSGSCMFYAPSNEC